MTSREGDDNSPEYSETLYISPSEVTKSANEAIAIPASDSEYSLQSPVSIEERRREGAEERVREGAEERMRKGAKEGTKEGKREEAKEEKREGDMMDVISIVQSNNIDDFPSL